MTMNPTTTDRHATQTSPRGGTPGVEPQKIASPRPPTHDEIARCAHDIYIAHGRSEGRSEQDWHQAEQELAGGTHASSRAPKAGAPSPAANRGNVNGQSPG